MKLIQLDHGSLSLQFQRALDRWSHQWVLGQHAPSALGQLFFPPWLTSIEGDSNEAWPSSPALQEIDLHQPGSAGQAHPAAVLGVGKSGHSHWSASFAKLEEQGKPGFQVELACLSKATPSAHASLPASRYRISHSVEATRRIHHGAASICLTEKGLSLIITPLGGKDWGSTVHWHEQELSIQPTQLGLETRKPTRWGYRISWELA